MLTVSAATTGLDGTISRHRTTRRNTRKVSTNRKFYVNDPQAVTREIHAGKGEARQREFLADWRIVADS